MFRKSTLPLGLALLSLSAFGPVHIHAQAQEQDASKYVEILPGTLPIILTAPHGGDLKPENILARRYGVTDKDANTVELTHAIIEELQELYGGAPHAVLCRMHRSKVDCNREITEAAQGDPLATATWERYHGAAEEMEKQVTRKFGMGLALDIHGQRHEDKWVEIGYLISGPLFDVPDETLNSDSKFTSINSIRDLDKRSPQSLAELLRGPQSLGGLLSARGFKVVPSPAIPSPGKSMYFSGSYDIIAHGSRDEGTVSAIQIECPFDGVRDTEKNRRLFAKALAASLGQYFEAHFQMSLGTSPPKK